MKYQNLRNNGKLSVNENDRFNEGILPCGKSPYRSLLRRHRIMPQTDHCEKRSTASSWREAQYSRVIVDGFFANQVLAQMHLWEAKFADLSESDKQASLCLQILPKKLDEEVAADMVANFGGVMTKLTDTQSSYINVPPEGPFKPESYNY